VLVRTPSLRSGRSAHCSACAQLFICVAIPFSNEPFTRLRIESRPSAAGTCDSVVGAAPTRATVRAAPNYASPRSHANAARRAPYKWAVPASGTGGWDRSKARRQPCLVVADGWESSYPQVGPIAVEMWKKEKSAKSGKLRSLGSCNERGPALVSPLRRARSASRAKPILRAVAGRRKSLGAVDGSETGSANDLAQRSFRVPRRQIVFLVPVCGRARWPTGCGKCGKKKILQIAGSCLFDPLATHGRPPYCPPCVEHGARVGRSRS
jgi:hypothetical protein